MFRYFFVLAFLISCGGSPGRPEVVEAPAQAAVDEGPDQVDLIDGQHVSGRVVFENDATIIVGQRSGTLTFQKSKVKEVRRGSFGTRQLTQARSDRLPSFAEMLEVVAQQEWIKDLQQVPATVIGIGDLRNIPYVSHRSGKIEFNVYGDPEHPAGVEIGVYDSAPNQATRERLRDFMVAILANPYDKDAVRALGLQDDESEREGLTFDVDPPDAIDSYGGWWLTIYDAVAMDRARATAAEMERLAVVPASAPATQPEATSWSSQDYTYSSPRSSGSSSSSSGSGRVYVRGYTRKNGTYVQPHTRSAPSRRR